MQEIKVLVPEARVPEFYAMFGAWLAGDNAGEETPVITQEEWGTTDEDAALARAVWGKLSDRAQGMFSVLMDNPEQHFTADYLAEQLQIPNGKYGVAGVLAWPGRHSAAVGRLLPVLWSDGGAGGSANYWMTTAVAELFRRARDGD